MNLLWWNSKSDTCIQQNYTCVTIFIAPGESLFITDLSSQELHSSCSQASRDFLQSWHILLVEQCNVTVHTPDHCQALAPGPQNDLCDHCTELHFSAPQDYCSLCIFPAPPPASEGTRSAVLLHSPASAVSFFGAPTQSE